ncbi:MAG: glycosyl hydrolase, partial [Gammaproteobacteria bacterium]|nr:glycosyl hydrolase [Gammaproteobacteria bacterium]
MRAAAVLTALSGAISAGLVACATPSSPKDAHSDALRHYVLSATAEIIVTNEAGDKLAPRPNAPFVDGRPTGVVIEIDPSETRQTLLGIGTSFTESSAFVLAHLEDRQRQQVMRQVFGADGANFSMARTPIGSTDFSVEGKYSYAEVDADVALVHFTVQPDR